MIHHRIFGGNEDRKSTYLRTRLSNNEVPTDKNYDCVSESLRKAKQQKWIIAIISQKDLVVQRQQIFLCWTPPQRNVMQATANIRVPDDWRCHCLDQVPWSGASRHGVHHRKSAETQKEIEQYVPGIDDCTVDSPQDSYQSRAVSNVQQENEVAS